MTTLKEFKEFLADNCYDLQEYKKGKYDRKIYNYFKKQLKTTKKDDLRQ